jgi:protein-S-isoprenylcysteine O-methyltransferase Ste14
MAASDATRILRKTPVRIFLVFPAVLVLGELLLTKGAVQLAPAYSFLPVWGYLQYRLTGLYRIRRGGGGPGLDIPPERLVTTGPYAYARNPMYLGHIIFMLGLALTLQSWLGGLIAVAAAVGFHRRVLSDEKGLTARFGPPYTEYLARVKRWIPALF